MAAAAAVLIACGGNPPEDEAALAQAKCIELCKQNPGGYDYARGPCLSDEIFPNWVCDVAHNPREGIDNEAKNQCAAFGHTAQHFIEVDSGCRFIRAE